MSNDVFPTLPGLKWDQIKTPIFSTRIQRTVSLRELRCALAVYPLYEYTLVYEVLRDDTLHNELKTLAGFYLAHYGAFDDWLYVDSSDSVVTGQNIGTASGSGVFQLRRLYGGFYEPCLDIISSATLHVYDNGTLVDPGNYIVGYLGAGTVTFTNPPVSGHTITADFSFYHRCRFVEFTEGTSDSFSMFMANLWEAKKINFITAR